MNTLAFLILWSIPPHQATPCLHQGVHAFGVPGAGETVAAAMHLPYGRAPRRSSEGWGIRASLEEDDVSDAGHFPLSPFWVIPGRSQLASATATVAVLLRSPLYPIPLRC